MELDEIKNATESFALKESALQLDNTSQLFKKRFNLHVWIETIVAAIATLFAIAALVGGHYWYPIIIEAVFPHIPQENLSVHPLMTFSLIMMACYCVFIPWKLHRAKSNQPVLLSTTLKERIDAEIQHYESLTSMWSSAHFWSFAPANIIGLSFFWGLQVSLTDQWWPSMYLIGYFVFVGLSTFLGFKLQRHSIENEIKPILEDLYQFKQDLSD